ncbi:MAG: DUF2218 domain-containing protein [Pseudorhodobacter sp.]
MDLITQTGVFRTAHAGKYLQQLCKHFGHKTEVRHDDTTGEVALRSGPARLVAGPSDLRISVSAADTGGLETARQVIDSHLARFAFREGFTAMEWQTP